MKNRLGVFALLFISFLVSCGGEECIECSATSLNSGFVTIACDNGDGTLSIMDSTNFGGMVLLEEYTSTMSLETFEDQAISDGLSCK